MNHYAAEKPVTDCNTLIFLGGGVNPRRSSFKALPSFVTAIFSARDTTPLFRSDFDRGSGVFFSQVAVLLVTQLLLRNGMVRQAPAWRF